MAYRIKRAERIDDAVRRIAQEQLSSAFDVVSEPDPGAPFFAVHQARKHCKKIRALLRLVRDSLGSDWRQENAYFRDAAGALARLRDADAMVQTVAALIDHETDDSFAERLEAVREALNARSERLRDNPAESQARLEAFSRQMRIALERARRWEIATPGFEAVADGFRKTYSQARAAMKSAKEEPTDVAMHEWRKRLKDYGYHVRLLRLRRKSKFNKRLRDIESLSDLLGLDHDLAVLTRALLEAPEEFGGESEVQAIADIINQRRRKFRRKAKEASDRVFADKPRRMMRRMEKYWENWRDEAPPDSGTDPGRGEPAGDHAIGEPSASIALA